MQAHLQTGAPTMASGTLHRGVKLLHDPMRNRGTAFTEEERDAFGLRGLLPPRVHTQDEQVLRVLENLRRKNSDLERYIHLIALQDRNETLFYRVLVDHIAELMPIVYTPTVGEACQLYGHIFRRPRGMFITSNDRGRIADVLRNWPHDDVRIVVVTDGERILGLGDLGADGMGIPVGKLALYSACAGIHPMHCLPITLDVGTDNQSLLDDPLYIGLRQRRLRGEAYDELLDEFLEAVTTVFPRTIVQLEDFANANAFRLLARYRDRYSLFDDDIQGTAAVVLAGLWSALRMTGRRLADQRLLFLGAGEAGIGIADLVSSAMVAEGMDADEARRHCWLVDSRGLVVRAREDLAPQKRPYAHEHAAVGSLLEAVEALRPTAIIGVSGLAGGFTRPVVEAMARINERPIIMALSNPTSKSECTAQQAYEWTGMRAIFASGSPFAPVEIDGTRLIPGQGNNSYIFPGVGLGAIFSAARHITDEMFIAAARALADEVTEDDLALGRVYPPLEMIREVSARIAASVARCAMDAGLAREPVEGDLLESIRAEMFEPCYRRWAHSVPAPVVPAALPVGDGAQASGERAVCGAAGSAVDNRLC
ncbi:MAG: NAD-dependent malic enzyme [Phycisphaerales bacterium JB039]